MMTTTIRGTARPAQAAGQLDLDALELLPCGCVVAIQSARPHPVRVISLEAKGPHCPLPWHRAGSVLRMGSAYEFADEPVGEEEEAFSAAP